MRQFIKDSQAEIAELCRAHHVRRLSVFGSAVREDFDPSRSDVDLLVEFEPIGADQYFDNKSVLRDRLVAMFARKVDLLTWKSIRNPYLLGEVEATHELLYAAEHRSLPQ
jgi:predicted nucleotidyltransferase